MLIAFLADIHANRPAFEACLRRAREEGAERYVLMGDYVGYGADPEWSVETAMSLVADGAVAVRGNHDNAVGNTREQMNVEAQVAIEWTRGELGQGARQFLEKLPMTVNEESRLYVHADASNPEKWNYVSGVSEAARSLRATTSHITFCGHIHRPAIYSLSATEKMTSFMPATGVSVPLLPGRRWLVVLGSVGQPRDGNPAASFALFHTGRNEITYCRAHYDIERAASKIREKGLPSALAERLYIGK